MTRTRRLRVLLATLTLAAAANQVHAQKMAPGLWESTMDMKSQNGEMEAGMAKMQAELAKMSPEQRKQMEAMMGARGMGMPGAGSGGGTAITNKVCISKETAERGEVPASDRERNCKRETVSRSGNTVKFKLSCTNPPATGEGEFTFLGDKAYAGRVAMTTDHNGKPETFDMKHSAKWISADCGSLKPFVPPASR